MGADEHTSSPDAAVESLILDYLHRELVDPEVMDPDVQLTRDLDLLSGGILNSIRVLRLAAYVGEQFGIEIQPEDFVIENFSSVAALASYVGRARSRTGGGDALTSR